MTLPIGHRGDARPLRQEHRSSGANLIHILVAAKFGQRFKTDTVMTIRLKLWGLKMDALKA